MPSSPFLALSEDQFEDLCCDLCSIEKNIRYAERFGLRGQRQHGIDIRAYGNDHGITEVGQCKRYTLFTREDFRTAIRKFRTARPIWESWGLRRFILFVASPTRDRKLQDEFQSERLAFAEENISLELWGEETLRRKLRDRRTIAENYFSGEPLRELCGSSLTYGGTADPATFAAATTLKVIEEYSGEVSAEAEGEIREARELARRGRARQALVRVDKYLNSARWNLLNQPTRARILRLRASLALDCDGDVALAESLVADARAASRSENYQVLDAAIALRKEGGQRALEALGIPRDIDALNFQLALRIQTGRAEDVLRVLDSPPFEPNAGTYRLGSISAVLLRDHDAARRFIDLATAFEPDWYLIRIQAAKVNYLHCILPQFPMWTHLDWPIPPAAEYTSAGTKPLSIFCVVPKQNSGI